MQTYDYDCSDMFVYDYSDVCDYDYSGVGNYDCIQSCVIMTVFSHVQL